MAQDVRFRHFTREGDWAWYAYDGELPVVDGVLTIPDTHEHWMRRAWVTGFRKDIGGDFIEDFDGHVARELSRDEEAPVLVVADETADEEPAEEVTEADESEQAEQPDDTEAVEDSAESAEESEDAGPDDGGQPTSDDGLRAGEPAGTDGLPLEGVDGSGGDGPAVDGSGD